MFSRPDFPAAEAWSAWLVCTEGGMAPRCRERLLTQGSGGGGGGWFRHRLSTLEERGGPAPGARGTQLSEPEEPDLECEAEEEE